MERPVNSPFMVPLGPLRQQVTQYPHVKYLVVLADCVGRALALGSVRRCWKNSNLKWWQALRKAHINKSTRELKPYLDGKGVSTDPLSVRRWLFADGEEMLELVKVNNKGGSRVTAHAPFEWPRLIFQYFAQPHSRTQHTPTAIRKAVRVFHACMCRNTLRVRVVSVPHRR